MCEMCETGSFTCTFRSPDHVLFSHKNFFAERHFQDRAELSGARAACLLVPALSDGRSRAVMSLHRANGAKTQSKFVEPSEREGFALAVGAIMQWSRHRDCSNPMFFKNIGIAVKDCDGTERNWHEDDIKYFVTQRLFGGIPQYAVEQWIQRYFMGLKGDAINAKRVDIIENFIYKHLSTVDAMVPQVRENVALEEGVHVHLVPARDLGESEQGMRPWSDP